MRTFTRRLREALPLPRASAAPCPRTVSRPLAASRPRTTTSTPRNQQPHFAARSLHTTSRLDKQKKAQEHVPASFKDLDVLGNTPVPSTSVDVCMYDGFGLNSGITITDGDGALLVDGEAFTWRPWAITGAMRLLNDKGQFDVPAEAFGVFDMLWPRPDLLIIGTGKSNVPLSPELKKHISSLGIRLEVLDTRNAASQFNLLATERGVQDVAAVLIPIGWKEGVGAAE
ncbi:hypothetical protein LMH87_010830 [Akanthomyces muscarius]|uniref:NADH dehydrogenase [ubiquinone] 1 alpha subcomplex assembly factor 3 n=1 Tax=Akanthomyces muscarius TaxID=2231603 RepID=A0A9W8UHW2_AKAMU|nr:hypothetical protein LMH87_010830 [Akanthomyces muscarius]KAJ4150063.1 hypothetical protein LMH87_010830 [Akanthomyces muscarius]